MSARKMRSKMDSKCWKCGGKINQGDEIYYDPDRPVDQRAGHAGLCETQRSDPRPSGTPPSNSSPSGSAVPPKPSPSNSPAPPTPGHPKDSGWVTYEEKRTIGKDGQLLMADYTLRVAVPVGVDVSDALFYRASERAREIARVELEKVTKSP